MGAVVELYEMGEVAELFERFLTKKRIASDNTSTSYENHIVNFFEDVIGKEMKYISQSDISNIKFKDFEKHIIELDGKYVASTINQRIAAVKSFLRYLKANEIKVNTDYFSEITQMPDTHNSHGILSLEEVLKMADISGSKGKKGLHKKLFILFALDTCLRKEAILSLKWSDFELDVDHVRINAVDKGNKEARKKISLDFYKQIEELKGKSDKVFSITSKTIQRMMDDVRDVMNISPTRNIVFHSIRKAGITFRYRITGDIFEAKKAGGWSNLNTAAKYIESRDYGDMGAVSFNEDVKNFDFNNLSKEQLIEVINNSEKDIRIILANDAIKKNK